MINFRIEKKSISYLLVILFFIASCQEENFSTKFENLEIKVTSNDGFIYADSNSTSIIEVSFDNSLPKDQDVVFTTSNGALFKMPYNPNSSDVEDTVLITPFSDEAKVLLLANTRTPDDEVFITVTINDFSKDTMIVFEPSYPDDMMFDVSSQNVNEIEEIELIVTLFKETGWSSNNLKFNIRSNIEVTDTTQNELITSIPEYALSQDNEIRIPINIVQYSPGSHLRVFANIEDNGIVLEKSTLIRFQ